MYRELLIGCGSARDKRLALRGEGEHWQNLTTLDHNGDHTPDVIWDMEHVPLPFVDDSFDEIHAYECLEHVGRQGDWRFFFAQWADFWRILKPGGRFYATVPSPRSPWALGDPSHTRILPSECLIFLSQASYSQVGKTPMSDFRFCYSADFNVVHSVTDDSTHAFILRAIKPSGASLAA